jgi:hypothetical protein
MGHLYDFPSELMCICNHSRNAHTCYPGYGSLPDNWGTCWGTTGCNCRHFTSTLKAEQDAVNSLAESNRLKDQNEEYAQFVKRNRCPKCGKGSHPTVVFHPDVPWYKFNSCKLGLKTEHIHLTCDLCKAHYSVKCLDKILDKLGINRGQETD